jgi:hypothetical protein
MSYVKTTFENKNAAKDGKWDAEHELGNRNSYVYGSASWRAYEQAYEDARELREWDEKTRH